ncbi:Ketose-bisphosphate aldolase, class-II [Melia azedarach]|uniref:Ketose-bisphosphate aldolase, class-II n=1 Tax=Melia azedarach TaxID=155640 RepID=A0ACC1YJ57_MELAZ|nr:Ketose-bisphosphate aldolase, class-II [Melia azedarach]
MLLEHIFNVYNMEGVEGVVVAAEEECRPVILQGKEFIDETGIDALAVCMGHVRGKYPSSGPNFGLDLLEARVASLVLKERRVPVPGALWSF